VVAQEDTEEVDEEAVAGEAMLLSAWPDCARPERGVIKSRGEALARETRALRAAPPCRRLG
jgi:hypothetical protein